MFRAIFGVVAFGFVISANAQLDSDTRFSKKLTFDERYLPLELFFSRVSQSSSVPFRVDKAIKERKIALFCEEISTKTLLEKVKETMFVDIDLEDPKKPELGYHVHLNEDFAREERLITSAFNSASRAACVKRIHDMASLASTPLEQLQQEARSLNERKKQLNQDTSEGGKQQLAEVQRRLSLIGDLNEDRRDYDLGVIASHLTNQDIDRVMNGDIVVATNYNLPGSIRIPEEALKESKFAANSQGSTPFDGLVSVWQFDPYKRALKTSWRLIRRSEGGGVSMTPTFDSISSLEVQSALSKSDYTKRMAEWEKAKDDSVLQTKLASKAEWPKSTEYNTLSLADNLQWLHKKSGVPIISDSFRIPMNIAKQQTATDIGEWLKRHNGWSSPYISWNNARVRSAKGWLMLRHRRAWLLNETEINESLFSMMEKRMKLRPLTIMDYAEFANGITDQQGTNIDRTTVVSSFPINPLVANTGALKLWFNLGPNGRSAAASRGLFVGDMFPNQREMYVYELFRNLRDRFPSFEQLMYLLPGAPALPRNMGLFYVDTSSSPYRMAALETNRIYDYDEQWNGIRVRDAEGATINFGTKKDSGVRFDIVLRVKPAEK